MVMRKVTISVIVLAVLALAACQSRDFFLFPTFPNHCHFEIDQTTSDIYEVEVLTFEDFTDSVGDLQTDALVESIDLEGFYLNFEIFDNNMADSAIMDAYIQDLDGNNLAVFTDFFVDISEIDESVNYPLYEYLKDDGVVELDNLITALVDDPDAYEHVVVILIGNSYPDGVQVRMDVDLHFRINAKVSPFGE